MFTLPFWRAAGERALRTVAQAILSLWVVGDVALNILTVDWANTLGIGVGAGVVSLLMSIVASARGPEGGPSFGTETPLPVKARARQ